MKTLLGLTKMPTESQPITSATQSPLAPTGMSKGFHSRVAVVLATMCLMPALSYADICPIDDFTTFVSGKEQCLVMRRFGSETPKTMVVWLHGDVSSGGPANYHFQLAEKFSRENNARELLSVALVRPGYPDGDGNSSSVAFLHTGRQDHYTKKNITEVAGAIEKLKNRFSPERTFVVGHSGGAATAAVMIGLFPRLVDGAILVACPCDLAAWRSGRRVWSASENPMNWVSQVPVQTVVHAITGNQDDNTSPQLAADYIAKLRSSGVSAEFQRLENESHNSAIRSPAVSQAVLKQIERPPQPVAPKDEPQASLP